MIVILHFGLGSERGGGREGIVVSVLTLCTCVCKYNTVVLV